MKQDLSINIDKKEDIDLSEKTTNCDFDIYSIQFINKTDVIEEVKDSYSGALIYKVIRGKKIFFVKVFKEKLNIEKIKKSASIYKELNIKSLDIIDFGKVDYTNQYYVVYNFIKGINLKEYTRSDKYSLKNVREFGTIIGKELLKLKAYENYDNHLFKADDIGMITKTAMKNFNTLLKQATYQNIVFKYFSLEEIKKLNKEFVEYAGTFKDIEPKLIHGDIKRANIMVDQNNNFYITDIESMQVNYDALNVRYQITWSLFDGSEKEAEFIGGYFDGIYSGHRPNDFNYNIMFTIILNFFLEAYRKYKNSNIMEFETYISKCQKLFTKINKLDLNKEFII